MSAAAIDWVIRAYTDGEIADEQMSALLMAIFLRGMARRNRMLDPAMVARREARLLRLRTGPASRKHSTGGVGDKTSLRLARLVACGAASR